MGVVRTIERSEDFLACTVPSATEEVSRILALARSFIRPAFPGSSPNLEVILRELLMNAVTHGNACDRSRAVRCEIERIQPDRLRVTVEDEGAGFDYRSLDAELVQCAPSPVRRGYTLIKALADHVEFNAKGNRVTVSVTLRKEVLPYVE